MGAEKNVPEDAGYEYTAINGEPIVEFHIDDCESFSTKMNKSTEFGGNLNSLFINAPRTGVNQWKKDSMFEEESTLSKARFEHVSLYGVSMT